MTSREFIVDRIEGHVAVLLDEDGTPTDVELSRLPTAVGEGTVLRVPVSDHGNLSWEAALMDEAAQERRMEQVEAILQRLRARDPGGDARLGDE